MSVNSLKLGDITGKIIGCAMEVHSCLGKGFHESIYQRALALEMTEQGLSFECEFEIEIFYKGTMVGKKRADFRVARCVMVELKAVSEMDGADLAQTINYLEAFDVDVALLINFGAKSLQCRRVTKNRSRKD